MTNLLQRIYDAANDVVTADVDNTNTTTEALEAGQQNNKDTQTIFAGNKSGSDVDARLDNALNDSTNDDTIWLEDATYTADRTISTRLKIIGTSNANFRGTTIDADWTIDNRSLVKGVKIDGDNSFTFNSISATIILSTGSGDVQLNGDKAKIIQCDSLNVTFDSSTSNGIVDSCTGVSVTDNGSNTVGDIS